MVVENLQNMPVWEWLLGPGWYQGAAFRPWPLALLVPAAVLAAAWAVSRLRRGPLAVSPGRGRLVSAAFFGILATLGLAAGLWALGAALGWLPGLWVPGPERAVLNPVAEGVLDGLAWLLGPGWFQGSLYQWLLLLACLLTATFVVGWLVAAVRGGPGWATARSGQVLVEALWDLVRISPRRVWALTWLAVRESIRRKVVVVFVVFVIVVLFAGWFLNPGSDQPVRLYIEVVLTATIYLALGFALILSALSLPADLKDRTLHTVVTKPVRKVEIVLGRVLGFALVGTGLLAGMGTISYFFVVRGLEHRHTLTAADLHEEPLPGNRPPLLKGFTSRNHRHQHEVTIDPSGSAQVEIKQGHWHELLIDGSGDRAVYKLGPPQGLLVARVPIYGKLRFKTGTGRDAERGVNVGDEWTYRSFIAGGTAAAAVWTFEGITPAEFPPAMFPDAIPVEMTIEVFRTHKGDIEKPVAGSLWLRNPDTGRKAEVRIFGAKKFATDVQWLPRTLEVKVKPAETAARAGKPSATRSRPSEARTEKLDLFRDLVTEDGRLEIGVQCLEGQQYFGMAQADLYFRARDASFAGNFVKGYLGIWLQMVLVLALGVMFSTFVSGPVALLATLGTVTGGMFSVYITELATGRVIGGGPFESFVRLLTQQNMISEMEPGLQTNVAQVSDHIMQAMLWITSAVLPAFDHYDFVDHVAYGFDVGGALCCRCMLQAAGFLLPAVVAGYFFLKMREVGQ